MFHLKDVMFKDILNVSDLSIQGHCITCITGESGSGKTTLLTLLNRMKTPDSGIITFQGQPLETVDPVELRRQVVMMAQEPLVFPGTIADNLQMGLRFSQKPEANASSLNEMLSMIKLEKSLDADPDSLSGGEKQRLALGRVLLMQPEVLLLDEPSSSLDDDTELLVIHRVTDYVKKTGKTLVMVTHSKALATSLGGDHIHVEKGVPNHRSGGA